MIAIIGLGNIGGNYQKTYHNIGFMALDKISNHFGLPFTKSKYNGLVAEGTINGEKVVLLKPKTYMNLSGVSVVKLVKSLKLDLSNILVIYDDIDLDVGQIRLRKNGSAGTHNGMRSIIKELGSKDFARLRIGIGRDERMDLADYVLSRVSPHHKELIDPAFDKAVNVVEQFVTTLDVEKINV